MFPQDLPFQARSLRCQRSACEFGGDCLGGDAGVWLGRGRAADRCRH